MTEAELQKLSPDQLTDRLREAAQRVGEARQALLTQYRECDRRQGKLTAMAENKRKSPPFHYLEDGRGRRCH